MRNRVLILLTVAIAAAVGLFTYGSQTHELYLVDLKETVDEKEAKETPPGKRWPVLQELDETISIEVICYPSYLTIDNPNKVKPIVRALQNAKYVKAGAIPKREPDVKLYFKKTNGFIMAGRLFVKEGVIESPEGPLIQVVPDAAQLFMANTSCGK